MSYTIQKMLLENVQAVTNKYEELSKRNGEEFNIFSILKMERLEYHTHSAFLYELLNPKGSHNQGDVYLKTFVRDILEIKDFKWENAIVERERYIGVDGRIDLIIESRTDLLIIEIKIDAGDQKNQLKRYERYAKSTGKDYKIYYLTLLGDEASQISVGDNREEVDYTCLSFSSDILRWLKKSVRVGNTPLIPIIRESLVQYIKLVEKITGQDTGEVNMEIKRLLLKDDNLKYADKLVQAIPYAKAEIEYRFWKKFYEQYNPIIKELGFEYEEDDFFDLSEEEALEIIVSQRKKKNGDIPFKYILKRMNNKELVLWIGQTGNDKSVYMSIGILEEKKQIKYTRWNEELLQQIQELGFTLSSYNKYKYVQEELNFYNDTIYKLLEDIDDMVKLIGEEIIANCKAISKRIDGIQF